MNLIIAAWMLLAGIVFAAFGVFLTHLDLRDGDFSSLAFAAAGSSALFGIVSFLKWVFA